MNIIEIDCESYATRVAYAAASELYGLLEDPDAILEGFRRMSFIPHADPDNLELIVSDLGAYVCRVKCRSGETPYLYLQQTCIQGVSWEKQELTVKLAFDLFVKVCLDTFNALRVHQTLAETATPPPNPPLKLEDSIFEPVGSLGELESYAAEASRNIATYDAAQAERRKLLEAEKARLEAARVEVPSYGPVMSAGEAPASVGKPQTTTPKPELPAAPKTRANSRGKRRGKA